MNSNDAEGPSARQMMQGILRIAGIVGLLIALFLFVTFCRCLDIAWHFPRYDQTAEATVQSHSMRDRCITGSRGNSSWVSLPYYTVKVGERLLRVGEGGKR